MADAKENYKTLKVLAKEREKDGGDVLPEWFKSAVLGPLEAKIANVFILHGDTNGLFPNPDVLTESGFPYLELLDFVSKMSDLAKMLIFYDIANGIGFPSKEMRDRFIELAEIKPVESNPSANPVEAAKAKLAAKKSIPKEPELCLPLIEKVLKKQPKTIVIINSAHFIFPTTGASGALPQNERVNIERLRNWIKGDDLRDNESLIFLVTNQQSDISQEIRNAGGGAVSVFIPKPDSDERQVFTESALAFSRSLKLSTGINEFTIATQGLNLSQIRDIFHRAKKDGKEVDLSYIKKKKIEILNEEYGDILEVVDTEHSLDDTGGLEHIKNAFRSIIAAIKIGETRLIPSGITLMGPPGTGKTFVVEGFAEEAEYNFVKIKNLRSKWVGESEAKSEKLRVALLSLAPVVVMNDESDLGGMNRDDPKGDSGVSERLMRDWMTLLSDPKIVGKIIVINCTNRIDRMDAALKRSGRSDDRWLLPMPSVEERVKIFEVMFQKLEEVPTEIKDFRPFAELAGDISGADIRKIVKESFKRAVRKGLSTVSEEHLTEAIKDFIPNASQKDIDLMHLLGILESSSREMLPPNTPDLVRGAIKRNLVPNLDLLIEQIKEKNIISNLDEILLEIETTRAEE